MSLPARSNHLDIEAIDSLADAIKRYQGGMVLVSHDFRLIDQVSGVLLARCTVVKSSYVALLLRYQGGKAPVSHNLRLIDQASRRCHCRCCIADAFAVAAAVACFFCGSGMQADSTVLISRTLALW